MIFVSYWGQNVLYHNNGDGTFTDVSEKAGVAGTGNAWGAGCCFLDYDRDGQLDLFVANYVSFDPRARPSPGKLSTATTTTSPSRVVRKASRAARTFCTAIAATAPLLMSPRSQAFLAHLDHRQWSLSVAIGTHRVLWDGCSGSRLRQRRLAGYLRGLRQRSEPVLSQQPRWNLPGNRGFGRMCLG